MKKGLSPVIGAVLLVMMVIAIGSGVFLWMRGSVTKAEEEALVQQECQKIDFIVDDFCYAEEWVDNSETDPQLRTYIQFNARNDAEEPELHSFLFFIDYDRRTISIPGQTDQNMEGYESGRVITEFIEGFEGIKQIRVVPRIKVQNKIALCEEKEVAINWEFVGPC